MPDDFQPPSDPPVRSTECYASVEDIFREVALMTPAPPKDEDPYQSEEYQKFVESMAQHCHCEPACNRPCDGVLAGGLCDGMESMNVRPSKDASRCAGVGASWHNRPN